MKVLLLSLAVGMTWIAQDVNGETVKAENGKWVMRWKTIYVVASNEKMISENGPLRMYFRSMKPFFNGDVNVTFYIRINCTCQKFSILASESEDAWYSMDYSGKTYFQVKEGFRQARVIYLANISEDAKVTYMLLALAPVQDHDLAPGDYMYFKKKIKDLEIPEKNLIKITGTDTCPRDRN